MGFQIFRQNIILDTGGGFLFSHEKVIWVFDSFFH
uniref:Uncharacterized protein n=1 Tax=Anguilla anguilla TaxID=7936 RepID=A0A0E9Q3L1_ANGAN